MLTGSILRGVTRKSCIELLKSWNVPVEERLLSVDELFDAAKNGTLEEAWCVGTAAVISPIGELAWNDEVYEVNQNRIGALSQKLYDELTRYPVGNQTRSIWLDLCCITIHASQISAIFSWIAGDVQPAKEPMLSLLESMGFR